MSTEIISRNCSYSLSHQIYESIQNNVSSYFTIDLPKKGQLAKISLSEKTSRHWQNAWKIYKVMLIRILPFSIYRNYCLYTEKYTKFLPPFVQTSSIYPLVEELAFRLVLYSFFKKTVEYLGTKEKKSKCIANVAQAIIFGFAHYLKDGHRFYNIGTSIAGFFYGLSDSWITSTVAHSL